MDDPHFRFAVSASLRLPRYFASLRLPTLGYTVDSFAPAQLALRANLRLLHLAPAPALDCLSLEDMRYRAGVRSRLISLRFTLRAARGSLSLYVRLCRPSGCLRQAVLVRTPPRCLTLRAAHAAYRATALLLGSQPAPAGMCSGFQVQVSAFSPPLLPSASPPPRSPRLRVSPFLVFTLRSPVCLRVPADLR